MPHRAASDGRRVLILAPYGRDAPSLAGVLAREDYEARVCDDIATLADALGDLVGVIIVTEEALRGDMAPLDRALAAQPDWSDPPFVVLAANPQGRAGATERARHRLPAAVTNAIILERPLGATSLTSAIASALRSRQKQFEMRDRLRELDTGRSALAQSEAELRLIADSLPVLIGFVDRDLYYRFANRAYEDWFYLPPEDVIGRPVKDVVGDTAFATRGDAMQTALAGREVRFELAWPHRDGRRRVAEIRYLPRRDAQGAVDGFHVFVIDVTDRKRTEEELEQRVADRTAALTAEMASRGAAEAALRQSQKMEAVGQLTGGIAHDFNNMLTGVIGALDIMKRRIANGRFDDLDRFMDAAATSAQRAAGLTARLLAFSRRQSLDARAVDVNALVASLEELLRRTIRENIVLTIMPGSEAPHAIVDPHQLESAIVNLAINARDAMPDGGRLTVDTRVVDLDAGYAATHADIAPGRYVVVAVSDTGAGMDAATLEKVFDPFFTTKPIGQGTGLGLSMVYGFARQSGGQVRVHSQPGAGTTVSIFLPATQDEGVRPEREAPTPVALGAGQTVLLVEDDPSVRLLVRSVLEELRYTAIEVEEATAAITVLESGRGIDLLITDVGLPGLNGRQLAEIARQHRPGLPVLFVTGYAENAANRARFLDPGMDMITKPFSLDTLASKISAMLPHGHDAPPDGAPS